jgi:hypothetical protein
VRSLSYDLAKRVPLSFKTLIKENSVIADIGFKRKIIIIEAYL